MHSPSWLPRPTERATTAAQNTYGSPTAGTSHPQASSTRQSPRQRSTACTSHADRSLCITLPCHNAATNPQILQQSRVAHTRLSPTGPYALNWATQPSDTLKDCDDLKCLGTGRVPGRPGLARPPAPQDHNPEGDTPNPRAPSPQIRLVRHPKTNPLNYGRLELPATHPRLLSSPAPVYPNPPNTVTPDPPSTSPPKTDPLTFERHELSATHPRLPSSSELI